MNYIINQQKLLLFLSDGKTVSVEKTDRKYASVIEALSLPKDESEAEILKLLTPVKVDQTIQQTDKFDLVNGEVYFNNEKLPHALSQKVKSIIEDGLPLENFENFWKNLKENPSSNSVNELINFLSYKELPITEDGHFLAYKGISHNDYSVNGNVNTRVLQGVVNSTGNILNTVGSIIEVLRRDVDDDKYQHCSYGLHVGSLNYAKDWGDKMVVVKVNPKDVVSVPTDHDFQKCRVCKYEVLYEFKQEIEDSVVDEKGNFIEDESTLHRKYIENRVNNYLIPLKGNVHQVAIRKIQSIFSPKYPSKLQITEALQNLGYYFNDQFVFL